jgi:hypothetical protein
MTKSSISVIPCSSTRIQNDVTIPVSHVYHEDVSYARVRSIHPVHPKFLKRKVCTLPESTIKEIQYELSKIYMPVIINNMTLQNIKDTFGITLQKPETIDSAMQPEIPDIKDIIKMFEQNYVLITANQCDVVTIKDMKSAFDRYCEENGYPMLDDTLYLVDIISHLLQDLEYSHDCKCISNGWKCMILKPGSYKPVNQSQEPDPVVEVEELSSGTIKQQWTDENIMKFLHRYQEIGSAAVSAEFKIQETTAYKYYIKWKSRIEIAEPPTELTVNNIQAGNKLSNELKQRIGIPVTRDIVKSVSKISNIIRDSMYADNVFDSIKGYHRNTKSRMMAEEFYNKLGSSVFHSLLELLGVNYNSKSGDLKTPILDENNPYLGTWYFFDQTYHDTNVSYEKDPVNLMACYRQYHGTVNRGIDQAWLEILKRELAVRLNLIDSGLKVICDPISKIFCAPEVQ